MRGHRSTVDHGPGQAGLGELLLGVVEEPGVGHGGVSGQRLLRGTDLGLAGLDLAVVGGGLVPMDGSDGEAGVADRRPAGR